MYNINYSAFTTELLFQLLNGTEKETFSVDFGGGKINCVEKW